MIIDAEKINYLDLHYCKRYFISTSNTSCGTSALFLQSWGKGPGPFKRGNFLSWGKNHTMSRKSGLQKKTPKNEIVKKIFLQFHFWGFFFLQKLGKNIYFLDRGMGPKYGPKLAIKKACTSSAFFIQIAQVW